MGNHSLDCPDCGRDQRNYGIHSGLYCCPAYREKETRRAQSIRAQNADRAQLFQAFGIEYHISGIYGEPVVRSESVAAFLQGLRTS